MADDLSRAVNRLAAAIEKLAAGMHVDLLARIAERGHDEATVPLDQLDAMIRSSVPPDEPCARCNGRAQWAPGVPCEACGGTGRQRGSGPR